MTTVDDGENGSDVQTNFIEELYDKFLECRLCSRTFRHPKMLACQHTFCADCLEAHYEMDEQDRPYRFLLSHNRDLMCPCCRARTPLPSGGVWRLPDNFLVANLTDVIRRRGPPIAAKSSGGGCEICRPVSIWNDEDGSGSVEEARPRAATVKCVDCDKLLCAACVELHRETKVTASHALFTVGDNRDAECKIHRNETLRFYCEPCEQCVCVLCALHEHNEHDVSSLADGLERHRATFDALLDNCKTRIDAVREQLTLADAFKSSLSTAEDRIRHAAIDAIAAVRQRERELLEGLRSFVGDDALTFLGERDALGDRLAELDNVCETMDTMIGRTSVELLITKKEVHERLRAALDGQQVRTPDKVRLGGVHYVAGAEPFRDLCRPTSDIGKLFRSVADDDSGARAAENRVTDESSSSSTTSSGSEESDSEEERRNSGTVRFVCQLPQTEHVDLVARSQDDSETEDSDSDDEEDEKVEEEAPVTKICISDGVVRRVVIKSQSLCDAAEKPSPPPPRPSGRKIPDFSRPKPTATYEDRGTEMERLETTDAATTTPRVLLCDKETYTGYVYLVHKNVSTDNQGTADKGTSMTTDVTAAYRSLSTGGRSAAITRGTNTVTATTADRASSPVAALRSLPTAPTNAPVTVAKVPAYPIHQRPGTAHAPSTTQKSTTSDATSATAPQTPPVAGRVPADAQKASGAANMAPHAPQATPSTAPTASAQPVSATAVTRQAMSAVSPTAQAVPTSSRLPATSQKLVTSSGAVSPVAATAPSQSVTSPPQPMTSSVVAVSTQSQQKLTTISLGSVTSATATAVSPTTKINLPSPAAAGSNQTVSSTAAQKPIVSSNGMLSKASSSPSASVTAQTVTTASSSQITSPVTQISNIAQQRPSSTAQTSSVPQKTSQPGIDTTVTSPTAQKLMTSALSQSSATNVPPHTAPSTDSSPSVNNNRVQTISSKASVVTSPVMPTSKQVPPPVTPTVTMSTAAAAAAPVSSLPASMQTSMTQEQSSWSRQSQPSPSKHPTPVFPSQSASVTAPAAQTVATASSSQITSPVTQISNVTQQRPSNIALSSSVPQKTSPQTSQSGIDTMATSPTAQKSMTSALSQSQTTSKTPPASMTSAASLPTQLQMSSSSSPATNTLANPIVPTTSQKPMSFVSPTTQPQSPAAVTTTVVAASENIMRQSAAANNYVLNAATSVLTTTQKLMTATAPSPTQMTAPAAVAQKPVTSPTSSTMQSQHPATAKTMMSQGTSINPVSNAATSMPVVTTTAQKLMTSNNGQLEGAASLTSPSSPSSAAVTENSAAAAITNVQTPPSPVTSPASRQRSVFRSFSTENLRSPAPVLRPPPPIMTTSVAAVTQRLNGGAANGSGKNNWRPNSNR